MFDISNDAKSLLIRYFAAEENYHFWASQPQDLHERCKAALTELAEAKLIMPDGDPDYPDALGFAGTREAYTLGNRLRREIPEDGWPNCPISRNEPEEAAPEPDNGYRDWPGKGTAA